MFTPVWLLAVGSCIIHIACDAASEAVHTVGLVQSAHLLRLMGESSDTLKTSSGGKQPLFPEQRQGDSGSDAVPGLPCKACDLKGYSFTLQ